MSSDQKGKVCVVHFCGCKAFPVDVGFQELEQAFNLNSIPESIDSRSSLLVEIPCRASATPGRAGVAFLPPVSRREQNMELKDIVLTEKDLEFCNRLNLEPNELREIRFLELSPE